MKKLLIIFLSLFCLTAALADDADQQQQKLYQVELIIFQRSIPTSTNTDLWSTDKPITPDTSNAVELHQPQDNPDQNYQLLPPEDFKLNPEANALKKSGKYKVIMHIAWLQNINSPRDTQPIHITGGNLYNEYGEQITNQSQQQNSYWQVNGLLWISYTRYFEVKTRLYFTAPSIDFPAYIKQVADEYTNSHLICFRMQQARRMKANELNYFDHPLFGVLIKITPLTQP